MRNSANSLRAMGLLAVSSITASAAVIYANNAPPGDFFSNAGLVNQGQAVGSTGWYYNNVRNSGTVGINMAFPRLGNASVYFNGLYGPGGASSKADLEYLAAAFNLGGNWYAGGSLGRFQDLAWLSYEWYRDASSTAAPHLHPVIRVLLDRDGNLATSADRGGLVFEGIYNGWGAVPVNTWVPTSVGPSARVWNFGLGLPMAFDLNGNGYGYDETLASWQAYLPSAVVLGFNVGIGSGWGPFTGAADNIAWMLDGRAARFNFETVPEPGTWMLVGGAFALLAASRRGPRGRT